MKKSTLGVAGCWEGRGGVALSPSFRVSSTRSLPPPFLLQTISNPFYTPSPFSSLFSPLRMAPKPMDPRTAWIPTITSVSDLTPAHRLRLASLSSSSGYPICSATVPSSTKAKHALESSPIASSSKSKLKPNGKGKGKGKAADEPIEVSSDDDDPIDSFTSDDDLLVEKPKQTECSKRKCDGNLNCLRWLGSAQWVDKGKSEEMEGREGRREREGGGAWWREDGALSFADILLLGLDFNRESSRILPQDSSAWSEPYGYQSFPWSTRRFEGELRIPSSLPPPFPTFLHFSPSPPSTRF